jgi:hypothetical protein
VAAGKKLQPVNSYGDFKSKVTNYSKNSLKLIKLQFGFLRKAEKLSRWLPFGKDLSNESICNSAFSNYLLALSARVSGLRI